MYCYSNLDAIYAKGLFSLYADLTFILITLQKGGKCSTLNGIFHNLIILEKLTFSYTSTALS